MPPAHNGPELAEQPHEVAVRADRYSRDGDVGSVTAILREHRHEILASWLEITGQQPFHAGRPGRARTGQILPLLDAVVNVLQSAVPSSVQAKAVIDTVVLDVAQRHARTRFEQGLQAADVMTEFRLLRQEIGRALRLNLPRDVAAADVIAAELLVHDALDGAINLALAALECDFEELREDMLATTVHDIQQPITGLKGRLQLALRNLTGPDPDHERVTRMIHQAVEETDRLSAMLSALGSAARVALSRVELHAEPTDLEKIVRTALERLGPETVARSRIDIPPDVVTTGVWDRSLLERVIANLLSNAAKYSGSSSPIEVTVRNEQAAVHLAVRDQGIGLAPDELGQLFQRYGRTRRARERGTEGAGLGLYVSRGIVEAHGGRIWAESAGPGHGTIVHFLLPPRSPAEP